MTDSAKRSVNEAVSADAERGAHPLEGSWAFERGRQFGRLYRSEGRDYGKPYPSNPYHQTDPLCKQYEAGYEEGFNGR